MTRDIEERLKDLGLIKSPFLNFTIDHPDFLKVFIDRKKEINRIQFSLESSGSTSRRNIAFIGRSRIGKTMLIQYTLKNILNKNHCLFFDYPPGFHEFCNKGIQLNNPNLPSFPHGTDMREMANNIIEYSKQSPNLHTISIDNFEEMIDKPKEEIGEFIRIFRRSNFLFIIACTEQEWNFLLSVHPQLRYAFSEEIIVPPFSLENCHDFFHEWLSFSRKKPVAGINPFTEDAARLIGIYSFFIPGCMNDLANRVFSETLSENRQLIDGDYVRRRVINSPVTGSMLSGLNDNEVHAIELMIEYGDTITFEILADRLGVSRVAAAGYIQELIDHGLAVKVDTPGKKKMFRVSEEFKSTLV
jgi:hypothetical protein